MTIRVGGLRVLAIAVLTINYFVWDLTVSAAPSCSGSDLVVGGRDTTIGEHPWQVALRIGDSGFCGGSLIGKRWVLTAAHCFQGSGNVNKTKVKAGATNYKSEGTWTKIDRIIVHEEYNPNTQENDLALLKLSTTIDGKSIALPSHDFRLEPCDALEVTGWGRRAEDERSSFSETLQIAEIPYVENNVCNEPSSYNGLIEDRMMCAGLRDGGVAACQGDSGGPLVYRGDGTPVLVGVVSWGQGCARKLKYGVYTRVTAYLDWIKKTIKLN